MSKEQAKEFFYEVAKNKELVEKVKQLMGSTANKETVAEKLISMAQEYGFNFTKEEAALAQCDFKIPLSEEDLKEISGGFAGALAAVVTFALTAFAGVSYLTNEEQPYLFLPSQLENTRGDIGDEDLDEFHPAMFDVQATDERDVAEENAKKEKSDTNLDIYINNFDEDSTTPFSTIRDEKMYKKMFEKWEQESEMYSAAQSFPYKEHEMVRISPGGGDDPPKPIAFISDVGWMARCMEDKLEWAQKREFEPERESFLRMIESVKVPKELPREMQTSEKMNNTTAPKVDEQKTVEQQ